jgi:hypothetical protein
MFRLHQIDTNVDENSALFKRISKRKFRNIPDNVNVIDYKGDNYKCVYQREYNGVGGGETLSDIWEEFNINHPVGFRGHSLSISDIVEIDGVFYYCLSRGWRVVTLINV